MESKLKKKTNTTQFRESKQSSQLHKLLEFKVNHKLQIIKI